MLSLIRANGNADFHDRFNRCCLKQTRFLQLRINSPPDSSFKSHDTVRHTASYERDL
jgi:hypothetical protein